MGFLGSGSVFNGNLYAKLTNNTGNPLSALRISYDVEKYRNGTNAAGFSIQMYYSTDGTTWTSAGSNFKTTFAGADANNNGFTTAPGVTVSVTNQSVTQAIPNGTDIYLAWNYAVTSGTTVTNAQGLAVDNINIVGLQPPSISKSFGTSPINVGQQSLLSIVVTNPNAGTDLTGVGYTDTLPTGLTIPDLAPTGQCAGTFSISSNTITATGITVPAGLTCSFASNVTASGAMTGVLTNNTSTVTSTNGGTGNFATAQITVNGSAASDHFRSAATGNWNSASTWQTRPRGAIRG